MSVEREEFREAMSNWSSGVTIVAVRVDERVVATTVSSFLSLSLDPPLVLVAIGPNATVRPFLQPGRPAGISVLSSAQRRLAAVYADPYPVGEDPFTGTESPVVRDALTALDVRVVETREGGDHLIVIASVEAVRPGSGAPLLRFRRRYHELLQ